MWIWMTLLALWGGWQQPDPAKPIPLNWMEIQRVPVRYQSWPGVEGQVQLPNFPEPIRRYANKRVEIDGFVIPLDKTGQTVVVSAYPMAECFFCGKAGPASVMTVKLRKPDRRYKTDDVATFRGILRLNDKDPMELFYVLEDAVPVRY